MYTPSEIIVQESVLDHPVTQEIVLNCPDSVVVACPLESNASDVEILGQYSRLYDPNLPVAERRKLGRKVLFLHGSEDVLVTMAAGANAEKRCHNFMEITPYRATCLFNCEYCWFKDPDLMLRVNVTFFDRLGQIDRVIEQEPPEHDTVLTFTHYKSDCLSIEHLTGFSQRLVRYFADQDRAYLVLLTKSSAIQPILGLRHGGHTIVQWTINADYFTRKYEHGTASLEAKLGAAREVAKEGYPVVFRCDPIFAFDGWREHYRAMVDTIFQYMRPDHVTLGVAKFQSLKEVREIIANRYGHDGELLREQLKDFVLAKGSASNGYEVEANPHDHTMSDMPYSYPDEMRFALLEHIISCFRQNSHDLSIGICEEPASMWDALDLHYRGHKNFDCACNFTGFRESQH